MDKYDFIQNILGNPKLTPAQQERVLLLAKEEIKKDGELGKELEERVKKLEEKISLTPSPEEQVGENQKNELEHNPIFVSRFLSYFKENTVLKWTTHAWDEKKYETIFDFITDLNSYKKEVSKLFNYNRDLYNLLNYFLYQPKIELEGSGIPKFGWPHLQELKIGWQFPNDLLINWCKENFDNKDDNFIKYPFQYPLPEVLCPTKPIKGKQIATFENVVDIFKTEIQFREHYLYKELKKRTTRISELTFNGLDKLKELDFYTYTFGFLSSFDNILNEIKKNETEKEIDFSYEIKNNELFFNILHRNSFPTRILTTTNPSHFLGGGLNAIAGNIFSVCDFSVISKFKENDKNETNKEILIVHETSKGVFEKGNVRLITEPLIRDYKENVNGFLYQFKFYL